MSINGGNNRNRKNGAGHEVKLYLRVHVMPKLNMPLKGKTWQWVVPIVVLAGLVFAGFYYLAD